MNEDAGLTRLRLDEVKAFYQTLSSDKIAVLDALYHPEVVFTDPAGSLHGRERLRRHFERLLANTRRCDFEFFDEAQQAGDDDAVLFWRMTVAADGLDGGRPFRVEGVSRLVWREGLIVLHRDYFDLGALLYERLPILGALVRRLRRRLEAAE